MLVLHGWASRHLPGSGLWSICLSASLSCPIAALFVDGFLRRYAGLSLGFTTSLAFSLAVFIALAWKRRWPLIPADGSTQWQLRLSCEGFAARAGPGPVKWKPWSTRTAVLFTRPRPDLCRARIRGGNHLHSVDEARIDLVLVCGDEVMDQVRAYISACRRGQIVPAPNIQSADMLSRAVALQSRKSDRTGGSGAFTPERCPQCGYDLAGLPDKGQCPECGFEYDPDSLIVLYGWNGLGPGQSSPSMASGCASIVLYGVLYGVLGAISGTLARAVGAREWVVKSLLMGSVMLVWLTRKYLRRRTDSDPDAWKSLGVADWSKQAQLRLTPAGFGLRAGCGPCRLTPFGRAVHSCIFRR